MTSEIQNSGAELTQPEGASQKSNGALEPQLEVKQLLQAPKKEPEQAPPPETISKVEHEKLLKSIKDGHAGTVAQMRTEREKLLTEREALEDKIHESNYDNWVRMLEEKGLDEVTIAKQARTMEAEVRKLARDVEKREARIKIKEEELNQAGKGKAAYDLAKEFSLDEAVVPQLLNAENDWAMRAKAQELYIEKLRADAQPIEKPAPQEPVTKGIDISKLSDSEKMGLAIQQTERNK